MNHITMNKEGHPIVRDLNLKVSEVFRRLGSGASPEEIIQDHPGLVPEDFPFLYEFAAAVIENPWSRFKANFEAGLMR